MKQANFKNDRMSWWERLALQARSWPAYRKAEQFNDVEKTLLFVGYPRSGHTLIGSLLDAHPAVLLAHELDVLYFYDKGYSQRQIDALILTNAQTFTQKGRQWMGYNYKVPNQWQGRFDKLKIIGDKSGGRTTRRLLKFNFTKLLPMVAAQRNRPIVFLHIIRNPYDVITTMMQRTGKRRGLEDSHGQLRKKAKHFFEHAAGVALAKQQKNCHVIDVYHEQFVQHPKESLARLCNELGLACTEDYLLACTDLVWKKASQSRQRTDLWSVENKDWVKNEMATYPWFADYTFEH